MYKCIQADTGEEILILNVRWRNQLSALRYLSWQDLLVCQGCHQPVRVRAGRRRRWHFAHKHLQNCLFDVVSPALLQARALLYEYLTQQIDPGALDVEVYQPEWGLSRPVDVLARDRDSSFAIWIIEHRLPPSLRQQITRAFSGLGIAIHYVFLASMLRKEEKYPGAILLTTTERELAQKTPFDGLFQSMDRPPGRTLHYLDPDTSELITYRDLHCVHSPQVYRGQERRNLLSEILLHPPSGALAHPGEIEQLVKAQASQERRAAKILSSRKSVGRVLDRIIPAIAVSPPGGALARPTNLRKTALPKAEELFAGRAVCQFCHEETDDWWYLDRKTGLCKCRACLQRGVA